MAGTEITLLVAFVAGLVSFLSPCVLPIIPGFLAYLAGNSDTTQTPSRRSVLLHSVLFVAGFAAVFATLGVLLNSLLSLVAYDVQIYLARIGGVIIIIFGFFLMGLLRIPALERAHTIPVVGLVSSRSVTSFLFGAAFAAGWTPCVSAALGAILGIAAAQPSIAFWLLMVYALGLGLPFLLIGFFATGMQHFVARNTQTLRIINVSFGAVLVILGVLIFTQQLARFANFEFITLWLP